MTGQVQRAFTRRADFEDRDPEQRGFDPARRVRARQGVSAGEAASRTDPGIGHGNERPTVPLQNRGEGIGALRRVWSYDETPVAVRLTKAVQEKVRLGLEVIRAERLAGPHRYPGGRAAATQS
ncbi:hypothetical protein ACIG63_24810 [Streptomyces antimycoticus]|uniref:hypothetical protein n=1 Tax=Streptomyces antimycoticus TaxID=68175 RepID=UPI0037D33DA5